MKFVVVTSVWGNIICVLKADTFYHDALKRAIEEHHGVEVTYIPDLTWPEGEGDMTIEIVTTNEDGEHYYEIILTLAHLYE